MAMIKMSSFCFSVATVQGVLREKNEIPEKTIQLDMSAKPFDVLRLDDCFANEECDEEKKTSAWASMMQENFPRKTKITLQVKDWQGKNIRVAAFRSSNEGVDQQTFIRVFIANKEYATALFNYDLYHLPKDERPNVDGSILDLEVHARNPYEMHLQALNYGTKMTPAELESVAGVSPNDLMRFAKYFCFEVLRCNKLTLDDDSSFVARNHKLQMEKMDERTMSAIIGNEYPSVYSSKYSFPHDVSTWNKIRENSRKCMEETIDDDKKIELFENAGALSRGYCQAKDTIKACLTKLQKQISKRPVPFSGSKAAGIQQKLVSSIRNEVKRDFIAVLRHSKSDFDKQLSNDSCLFWQTSIQFGRAMELSVEKYSELQMLPNDLLDEANKFEQFELSVKQGSLFRPLVQSISQ